MLSSLYFDMVTTNYSKTLAATAAEPTVAQQSSYYLANIGNVKSVDDLLNNSKLYNYVMNAFGLSDMTYAKGLVKQVLEGGVTSSKALANTLNNANLKALATAFNFAANGTATTSSPATQQAVVNQYVEQKVEATAGQQSTGAQMALYFQNHVSSITDAYSILADKTLLSVVQTALGLSTNSSHASIDLQAQAISAKLNVSSLQNPATLTQFLKRFTALYDAKNGDTSMAAPTNALLISSTGISSDLLQSLANLKLGGA